MNPFLFLAWALPVVLVVVYVARTRRDLGLKTPHILSCSNYSVK